MAEYDIDLPCSLGKINAVLNALSWKSATIFLTQQKELLKEIKRLV